VRLPAEALEAFFRAQCVRAVFTCLAWNGRREKVGTTFLLPKKTTCGIDGEDIIRDRVLYNSDDGTMLVSLGG
jgi:hypothetical protein